VRAEQERERSSDRFRSLVESSPDAILVIDADGTVLQGNGRAHRLLGGDPLGQAVVEFLPVHGATSGRAVDGIGFDGRSLVLDVEVTTLNRESDPGLLAVYLRDARPRLASEAMAASLREVEVRRRQAIEINDNLVQGLTAAVYSLEHGDLDASAGYMHKTLSAARRMMNDLLGSEGGLAAGDLVREAASTLPDPDEIRVSNGAMTEPAPPGRRVLIADDSDDVRMLVRMKLEMHGVADVVGEAEDGVVAVEKATTLQPDLVLLDLAMPRMDGLEALPLIRNAAPNTRVVVLSGFDENTMAKKALAAGAVRYVEKGVALSQLARLLDEIFDAPEPVGS
jgi:CheY-like chemotaxis protein